MYYFAIRDFHRNNRHTHERACTSSKYALLVSSCIPCNIFYRHQKQQTPTPSSCSFQPQLSDPALRLLVSPLYFRTTIISTAFKTYTCSNHWSRNSIRHRRDTCRGHLASFFSILLLGRRNSSSCKFTSSFSGFSISSSFASILSSNVVSGFFLFLDDRFSL